MVTLNGKDFYLGRWNTAASRAEYQRLTGEWLVPTNLPDDEEQQRILREERRRLRKLASEWRAQHCWSPNQLRHSAATEIRGQFGLEAAQVISGHAKADVTQVYAERNMTLGAEVMRKLG